MNQGAFPQSPTGCPKFWHKLIKHVHYGQLQGTCLRAKRLSEIWREEDSARSMRRMRTKPRNFTILMCIFHKSLHILIWIAGLDDRVWVQFRKMTFFFIRWLEMDWLALPCLEWMEWPKCLVDLKHVMEIYVGRMPVLVVTRKHLDVLLTYREVFHELLLE